MVELKILGIILCHDHAVVVDSAKIDWNRLLPTIKSKNLVAIMIVNNSEKTQPYIFSHGIFDLQCIPEVTTLPINKMSLQAGRPYIRTRLLISHQFCSALKVDLTSKKTLHPWTLQMGRSVHT